MTLFCRWRETILKQKCTKEIPDVISVEEHLRFFTVVGVSHMYKMPFYSTAVNVTKLPIQKKVGEEEGEHE